MAKGRYRLKWKLKPKDVASIGTPLGSLAEKTLKGVPGVGALVNVAKGVGGGVAKDLTGARKAFAGTGLGKALKETNKRATAAAGKVKLQRGKGAAGAAGDGDAGDGTDSGDAVAAGANGAGSATGWVIGAVVLLVVGVGIYLAMKA